MKRSNILAATALSLCLSFSAQASLTSEAMDLIRISLSSSKKEVLTQTPEKMLKSSSAFAKQAKGHDGIKELNAAETLILLKKPVFKNSKISPGIIIRKGMFQDLNNAADTTWIGVVVPQKALSNLKEEFHLAVSETLKENPTFDIEFIMFKKRMFGDDFNDITGNVNHTHLHYMAGNIERAFISGKQMSIVNIPISKNDSIEDVLELINILDNKIELKF